MTASSITVPAFDVNLADFLRAAVDWNERLREGGTRAILGLKPRNQRRQSIAEPAEGARKRRRPPLDSLLKQAGKAGKSVKGAVVYSDRTVLQFGESKSTDADTNPWDVAAAALRQKKEPLQ